MKAIHAACLQPQKPMRIIPQFPKNLGIIPHYSVTWAQRTGKFLGILTGN